MAESKSFTIECNATSSFWDSRAGIMFNYLIKRPALWIPLLILLLATLVFRFTNADLLISQLFFAGHASSLESDACWPLKMAEPWKWLYNFGVYPAWIMGGCGLLIFLISFFGEKVKSWRDAGLFMTLMLALGPGLMINGILKPYWGRPRPHVTVPFGGTKEFLPVGQIGTDTDDASFPSGHASTGFYLMAPGFLLYRRRPGLAAMFFALGLAGGTIMGLTRIVAGAHFASDVLWSAGIVYFTGLGLAALFHFGDDKPIPVTYIL
jgi:lipid A 4'-phosphatase